MSRRAQLRVLTFVLAFLPSSTFLLSAQLPALYSAGAADSGVTAATTDARADAFGSVVGDAPLKKEDGEGQSADGPDCALMAPWSMPSVRCAVTLVAEHRPLAQGHWIARHAARGPPRA